MVGDDVVISLDGAFVPCSIEDGEDVVVIAGEFVSATHGPLVGGPIVFVDGTGVFSSVVSCIVGPALN